MNEFIVVVMVASYFLAGAIKGMLGIGFPTAAITLAATVVDARTAIAYVVIPMCLINAWQIYRSGHLREVVIGNWRMVVSMVVAIGIFSLLSVGLPIRWLTLVLGCVISLFSIVSLWRSPPAIPEKYTHIAQWVTGSFSGVLGGLAGIWAPPIIAYLTARRVSSEEFVQIVGVLLFIGSAVLLLGYSYTGVVNANNAIPSFLLLLPTIAGFTAGEKLRGKIAHELFQKAVLVFFLILGLNFVRRAILM